MASHYRKGIYNEMQKQMKCHFVFGLENSTVKELDSSVFEYVDKIPNIHILKSRWYYQPGLINKTKNYEVIINDLGIFCLSAWALLLFAKIRKQKIYHWDHGWYGRENFIKKILKRLYFGLAKGAFIYGDHAIRLMGENGFNVKKLYPIHNSLDYERQLTLRKRCVSKSIYLEHFGNNCPVLIMIGRLNLRKNLYQLIEAVGILRDKGIFFNVILIGDGEDKPVLENIVSDLELNSQIWFYGPCYNESVNAELLYNSDLCVVPGDIGLTAIHSMMFGVPVITHDYFPSQGPESEVIKDGITGSFFKYGDINSLASVISDWFDNHSEDRDEVRENCYREIDENWTPSYQMNVLKKVIYG